MTHAERIREYVKTVGEWDDCMATYAALLAGAEALEREEERATLLSRICHAVVDPLPQPPKEG